MAHGWKPGQDWAECRQLSVTDAARRPIRNASVILWTSEPGSLASGQGMEWTTDALGRVCEPELLDGGSVEVTAPEIAGGECAGVTRIELEPWSPGKPPVTNVELDLKPPRRMPWRGRVVSEAGKPIAGASVVIQGIAWTRSDGETCAITPDVQVETASSGVFSLPPVPRGSIDLEISKDGYAHQELRVDVPGPQRTVVLARGGTWTGRVLDPDGMSLDECKLFLEITRGHLITSSCSLRGFALKPVRRGKSTLQVRLWNHPKLGTRSLVLDLSFDENADRVEDIQWPRGESIAGQLARRAAGVPVRAVRRVTDDGQPRFDQVTVVTGDDGRFVFRHLVPGVWTLRTPLSAQHRAVEVPTGSLDVRLVE